MAVTNIGIKWPQRRAGSAREARSPGNKPGSPGATKLPSGLTPRTGLAPDTVLSSFLTAGSKDGARKETYWHPPQATTSPRVTSSTTPTGHHAVDPPDDPGKRSSPGLSCVSPAPPPADPDRPPHAGDPRVNLYKLARRRMLTTRPANQQAPLVLIGYNVTNHSFEDISCLGESHSLSEISLDGNPFAQDPHYKQTVLRYMQQLRQLDMKRISEDERRISSVMARKDEEKKRENNKVAVMKERRRVAISNARRQWEVMQGSLMSRSNKIVRSAMPEIYANHVANVSDTSSVRTLSNHVTAPPAKEETEDNESSSQASRTESCGASRPASAKSALSEQEWPVTKVRPASGGLSRSSSVSHGASTPEHEKGQLGGGMLSNTSLNTDHLTELDGDTLHLYGSGSLDAFDKNWGIQAAGSVTTICFKFIEYDEITKALGKIRVRFPNVHTLFFNSTNITTLSQLNALSGLRRLDNLIIDSEGNPITQFSLWRTYSLFRLAHFCLKKINDIEVSASDIVNAEKFFGTLAHMTTSQLPQARLLSLLGEKKKQFLAEEKTKKTGSAELKISERSSESVGRAGLVYNSPDSLSHKSQEQQQRKKFAANYVRSLAREAILTDQKQSALHNLWPQVLTDMVRTSVLDMWDLHSYSKASLDALERS